MFKLKLTTKGKIEMTISATLICSIFNGLGIRRNRISECAKKSIPEKKFKKLRSGDNEKMKKIAWFKNR
jgi:hypothetical protein